MENKKPNQIAPKSDFYMHTELQKLQEQLEFYLLLKIGIMVTPDIHNLQLTVELQIPKDLVELTDKT
jgi:hypothetical protein